MHEIVTLNSGTIQIKLTELSQEYIKILHEETLLAHFPNFGDFNFN